MNNYVARIFFLILSFQLLLSCGGGDTVPPAAEKAKFNLLTLVFDGTGTGTVTINPTKTQCSKTCSELFTTDTKVSLSHTAATGSKFIGYGGASDCSDNEITMSVAVNCTATFNLILGIPVFDLNITMNGTGTGIVTSNPAGIECDPTCTKSFTEGSNITLTATPANGSVLVGWTGPGCTSGVVAMNSALNCVATFDLSTDVILSINLAGTGSGSVKSTQVGIDCGTACDGTFTLDSSVTLTATPAVDNTFVGWGGDCSGTTAITTITMSAAKSCIANFDVNPSIILYNLSVNRVGGGSGRVISIPNGIDCSTTTALCDKDYAENTSVTLTATATDATSIFAGWSGACTGSTGSTTVTMTAAKTCTATFNIIPIATYSLTVRKNGSGTGIVTSSPIGISCGGICNQSYDANTNIILSAVPADNTIRFAGWSGDCFGTAVSTTVSMTVAKVCTATFDVIPVSTFNLNVSIVGNGTVSVDNGGVSCGTNCWTYNDGATAALTANSGADSTFSGWTGTGCSTGSVSMTRIRNCTATFTVKPPVTYNLNVVVVGNGTVSVDRGGVSCGTNCWTYNDGVTATLTANSGADSTFSGWTGTGCLTGRVAMTRTRSCTATFTVNAPTTYPLSISILPVAVSTVAGKVTSTNLPAINCGLGNAACSQNYAAGSVSLTAAPASGYRFVGWGGICSGITATINLIMPTNAASCTATFALITYPLNVSISPESAAGNVTSSTIPATPVINCGGTSLVCRQNYVSGQIVSLVATPADGYRFVRWSGICGISISSSVDMTMPVNGGSCTATFEPTFTLALTVGTGGQVTLPDGTICSGGTTCNRVYLTSTVISLNSLPDSFASTHNTHALWSGACTGRAQSSSVIVSAAGTTANCSVSFVNNATLSIGITNPIPNAGIVIVQPVTSQIVRSVDCAGVGPCVANFVGPGESYRVAGFILSSSLTSVVWTSSADCIIDPVFPEDVVVTMPSSNTAVTCNVSFN